MTTDTPRVRLVGHARRALSAGGERLGDDPLPAGLRHAWEHLEESRSVVGAELGSDLSTHLAALWAVVKVAGLPPTEAAAVLDELVDDQLRPRFSDWLIEEVALHSFTLGAAWERGRASGARRRQQE